MTGEDSRLRRAVAMRGGKFKKPATTNNNQVDANVLAHHIAPAYFNNGLVNISDVVLEEDWAGIP